MSIAFVTPISRKAKNRFSNLMDNNNQCIIEQHKGNRVFLTSENGKNHFWVMLDKDPDWMIDL
jgi:predicted nucleic acid-binding Zn finger protein